MKYNILREVGRKVAKYNVSFHQKLAAMMTIAANQNNKIYFVIYSSPREIARAIMQFLSQFLMVHPDIMNEIVHGFP